MSPHTAPTSYSDARHPYSTVREAAGLVFVSGQLGVADGEIVPGGIEAETRQAFDNLDRALAAVGLDRSDIVKIVVYLTSLADRLPMDEVYVEALSEPLPARTCFAVGELPFGARIELDVTAAARGTRGAVG